MRKKKQKWVIIFLAICLLVGNFLLTRPDEQVLAGNQLTLHIILKIDHTQALINGIPFTMEVPPLLISGRVMVPLRFLAESFGAQVYWDGKEKQITFVSLTNEIKLWVGKNLALINGKQFSLETPPVLIEGRVLVPLRFMAEALGATVNWKPQSKEVEIIKILAGEVVLSGQVVGIDLTKREFLLLWGKITLTMVEVDKAIIEGKATRLEDLSLRMPVVIWGTIERNQIRLKRVFAGTYTPPTVQEQIIKGVVKEVNLINSLLLVGVDDGRTLPVTIHPRTELILDGKTAVLADFKRGFRVIVTAHLEQGRTLALQVRGEKTPTTLSGTIASVQLRELGLLTGTQTIKIIIDSKTEILVDGRKVSQGWLVSFRNTVINKRAQVNGFYQNGSLLAYKIEIIR